MPKQLESKAEDYDSLVWSSFVVIFGRREHAHKQQFCCRYAAHAVSSVFYYSPYYAAGSSTFSDCFYAATVVSCRIMLLDGVA